MKNVKKIICFILATLFLTACGNTEEAVSQDAVLSETTVTMTLGETMMLSVQNYESGIIWVSSNAQVAAVSDAGEVTAAGIGSAAVTAKLDGEVSLSCLVSVEAGESNVQSISVTSYYSSSSDITIDYQSEGTAVLRASCLPSANGEKLIWASSNENVATVDQNGNVTAHANGVTEITVTAMNAVSGSCTIRVKNAPSNAAEASVETGESETGESASYEEYVEEETEDNSLTLPQSSPSAQSSIVISSTELYLDVAEDYQLSVEVSNAPDGTYVTWESSREAVAIVRYGRVVAVGEGIALINAYTTDGAAASCYVAVGKDAKKELRSMLGQR
ncbi:MAG: Ig-like domain-containing protein [Clostridia bacterium]|nr:Ig-like domain-containing protein [Clostridia bacterium]